MSESTTDDDRLDRFARGAAAIEAVHGASGAAVVNAIEDVSPDLAHEIVAWGYGDVYSRPQLPPRDRQLLTIGILAAMGGCEPELETHVRAALNVGLTPEQILEAFLHVSVYCGFPRSINATVVAKKIFAERGIALGAGAGTDA